MSALNLVLLFIAVSANSLMGVGLIWVLGAMGVVSLIGNASGVLQVSRDVPLLLFSLLCYLPSFVVVTKILLMRLFVVLDELIPPPLAPERLVKRFRLW
jgi:hypothetical protein